MTLTEDDLVDAFTAHIQSREFLQELGFGTELPRMKIDVASGNEIRITLDDQHIKVVVEITNKNWVRQ